MPDCYYEVSTKRDLPAFVSLEGTVLTVKPTKKDLNSKEELEVKVEFVLETIDLDHGNVIKTASTELYILV